VGEDFFFSSRRRHTRSKRDWSSDVCSSDLDYLKKIIHQMVEEGVMREEVALGIDVEKIERYFQTPFGQEIIKHQDNLEKEVLFSLMMEAREIGRASCRERV